MNELRGHRLERLLSVFVCAIMLTGFLVLVPDDAKAFPDTAWIVGNVTDGGNPVENVYIKSMLFIGNGQSMNSTTTDVNGDYAMMVPGGLTYIVFAAHEDYYMVMNSVTVSPGETRVSNFTLTAVGVAKNVTISGYVTDELGIPRSDGRILGFVNNPMGGDMPYYANVTTPDPSGYFEVNVIAGPNGGGAIAMDFPGYPMVDNGTDAPLMPGMSYNFDIQLVPMSFNDDAVVYGYVRDVDTGLPLESALVSYEMNDGMDGYQNWTLTNETGYYEMDVQSGNYTRLTIQRTGYTVKFFEIDVPPLGAIQQDAELMKADAKIRGTVKDGVTGIPMPFCRVFLIDNTSMQENITMAITDFNGYYELDAFEGNDLYFGAQQDGYAQAILRINVTSGDELWYDLSLMPYSAWLVGQVTDAITGLPIEDAQVHVWGPVEEHEWTDWTGMYNISMVPGNYTLEVNRWGDYKQYLVNLSVPAGTTVYDISLIPWQNAILKGQVYDIVSGDPVPNADIWLSGWWGSWTRSNATGHYEMLNVDGTYNIDVNAADYEHYSSTVFLPELSVTTLDIGLMPRMPEQTCLLHGFVTSSEDSSPINNAEVRIRLESGSYENFTWSNESGYYEMFVPAWTLNVRVTAYAYSPFFVQVNLTGLTDFALDGVLDPDPYRPNLTHSMSPLENISWSNAAFLHVTVEEDYLREMTLMYFMEWNSSGLDSNWTMVNYQRTSFDPWNPQNDLPYSIVDGNYSVDVVWGTWQLGGRLFSNGTDQGYFPASTFPWYAEPAFAVSGAYSNSTMPFTQGIGLFNMSTGQFMAFWPYGMGGPIPAPDPTGVFEPIAFVLEFEDGMIVEFNWRSMGAYDIDDLTFSSTTSLPSGNYMVEFYCNDWGGQGNAFLYDASVDNDGPTADAGPDQNVPQNSTVTLDGRASYDNVGVSTYMWEFYDPAVGWVTLWGDVATYSFSLVGSYNVSLTVWDGAGHMSTDELVIGVFVDLPPIADAGPDQTVDEDTVVTFDGSGSTDDNGIVDYTWWIAELGIYLYGIGPAYSFDDPGTFHVSLVVEDTVGQLSISDEVVITVNDVTPPVADAGPDQIVRDGDMAIFDGSGSSDNGMIVDYVWSFTDIVPWELHGIVAGYTFSGAGVYLVTLTVYDEGNNSASDDMWVTVDDRPVADAGPDQLADEDTLVLFDGSGSWDNDGISDYTWTILELSVEMYGVGPSYSFADPGIYHVWLVVRDTMGQVSDPDEMIVTVNDVTAPTADAGPDQLVNYEDLVTFDGSASYDNVGIVDYNWSFFDGVPVYLSGVTAYYTFNVPGTYQVFLTVTDGAGNWATDDMWLYVNGPPTAVTNGDQIINSGDWANLNAWSSSDDFDPWWAMEYIWTFTYAGSEVVENGIDIWYEFVIPGEYTITLTVRDSNGLEDSDTMVVTVRLIPSAWWVDPRTGDSLADGATISLDYVTLRGYGESNEDVVIITATTTYWTTTDDDGYFELDPLPLSEGLNVVTILTYSDWVGQTVSLYKLIQSDTFCTLRLDSVESPTSDATAEISGWTEPGASVEVMAMPVTVDPDGSFSTTVDLGEGMNSIFVRATDAAGNVQGLLVDIELDTTPPSLVIVAPLDGSSTDRPNVLVHGTTDAGATVWVNGAIASDGTADWDATVALTVGNNSIAVIAEDAVGNRATLSVSVTYVPPVYVTPDELAAVRAELNGLINNLSAAMQENVTDLQNQIDSLTASLAENITDLNNRIDVAMAEIAVIQNDIANLTAEIASLQAQIDAAVAEIALLQAQVGALEDALDENYTDLNARIDAALADIASLQAQIDAAEADIATLQTEMNAAEAEIDALQASLAANVTALQNQINTLNADVSDLEDALAENVTALTALIDALANSVDVDVASLQAQIDSAEANITALQNSLATQTAALQTQIDAVEADVAALETELATEVADLQADMDTLELELANLNGTVTDDIAGLQDQIDQINEDLQDQIDQIDEQSSDTDAFVDMLMYLTLILFAIAIAMIAVVWYLMGNKMRGGKEPGPPEALEEVEEGPTDVEKEFEQLEKEIKNEEL